jgi:hypothetical protein
MKSEQLPSEWLSIVRDVLDHGIAFLSAVLIAGSTGAPQWAVALFYLVGLGLLRVIWR